MSLFWPCLLLLITFYLLVVNKYSSDASESYQCVRVDVFVVINVVVVVLLVVTAHVILSCGQ